MKKWLAVLGLIFAATAPAAAYFEGGVDQTFGSSSYAGTSGYAKVGSADGLYFRPRFNLYKSNFTRGTYDSFYGRVGYDAAAVSVGVEGGATPKVSGYNNASVSGDVTFTLTSGGEAKGRLAGPNARGEGGRWGEGLTRLDIGALAAYTAHREDASAAEPQLRLGQTDVAGFAGVKFFGMRASGQITKSNYDKSIPAGAMAQPNTELVGVRNLVSGFTDYSYNLKAEGSKFLFFSPFISYTYTKFKLNQPDSRAVGAGVSMNLNMLDIRGAYQYYDTGGVNPRQSFISLGASLNF